MTIKYISFDLDDTFWDVMPTIYKAEELTTAWIKENYPGTAKLMASENMTEVRKRIVQEDPSLQFQISKLRKKIFYDSSILAGYNEEEARDMSENAFNVFIEGRNNVTLFEGVMDTLESLQKKYSLGVITNGNADLKQIGMDHLFEHLSLIHI